MTGTVVMKLDSFPVLWIFQLCALEYISAEIFNALGWEHSSVSKVPALQAGGPEFDTNTDFDTNTNRLYF